MKNEKTYFEIMNELYEMIETDNIPKNDKEEIMETMNSLQDMLWKYSA